MGWPGRGRARRGVLDRSGQPVQVQFRVPVSYVSIPVRDTRALKRARLIPERQPKRKARLAAKRSVRKRIVKKHKGPDCTPLKYVRWPVYLGWL